MDFIFGEMDFEGLLIIALGDRKIYRFFNEKREEDYGRL